MPTTTINTYEGSREIRALTPDGGKGGLYKDFKNLRLGWHSDGQMYLKADCPNSRCESGQVCYEMDIGEDDVREWFDDCPDCEGGEWVVLDLEFCLAEDKQVQSRWAYWFMLVSISIAGILIFWKLFVK